MIGQSVGAYRVLAELGRGGMGEVYRARDTKLNRDVALKILPEAFAADPDRLMRFTREAQTLALLNHPHIAHIHGLEEVDGIRALVMELVEGEDLSARIGRGAMPLEDVLPIARQVAEALEAAHEAGIIHRDLKPANIKVKADGTVKVLDFGLAKALDAPSPGAGSGTLNPSNSPTMTSPALTALGLILGTAAYMSPEQAKGRPVDRRADIWAFGVVLFEMLTGQRCFKGDDVSETLASVLKDRPPIDNLPAGVPSRLKRLIERCLDRDPRHRLRDIGEARIALEELSSKDAGADGPGDAAVAFTPVRRIAPWVAAALLAGLALGWIGFAILGRTASAGASGLMMRVSVPAFAGLDVVRNIAPASDDRFVVYLGEAGGKSMLYLHDFESGEVRPLAGTEAAESPFLSPDGLWVGFRQGNHLMKLRLSGGDAVRICQMPGNFPGAVWAPDNTIVFPQGWLQGLSKVSADGGEVAALTAVNAAAGEKGHWWPRMLPDGRHLLFTIWNAGGGLIDSDVAVVDLQTGQYRKLVRGADAWFLPPGYLVYYHAGSYQATTLDPDTLEAGKESTPVLEDATDPMPQGTTELGVAISARGTLFYLTDQLLPLAKLVSLVPGRAPEPLPFPARAMQSLSLSPDGQKLAASSLESGVLRMHMLNLQNGIDERLDLAGSSWGPYWKHDNSGLAFVSMRKGDFDIYYKNLGGGTPDGPLRDTPTDEWPMGWSADGTEFFFTETQADGSTALKVRSDRDPKDEKTIIPSASIDGLAVSADGRWMAYDDTRGGQDNVYVRPYPGTGAEVRVSAKGGDRPAWSPDGTELYYRTKTSIVAVPFTTSQSRFQPGAEHVLWTSPLLTREETPLVVRGRRHFIVALRETAPVPPVLNVVLNWTPVRK